ncbi:recombinase family protein, partial [Xylella fastidiosa subsp. fastidiosa]
MPSSKNLKPLNARKCSRSKSPRWAVGKRAQLEAALEFLREGDVLVVTKLDRLARSVADLMQVIQTLDGKSVGLRVLNLGMDTHTPTGKLMLTVLGGVVQFKREMMLERQREGVARAKDAGKYKGRKPISAAQKTIHLSNDALLHFDRIHTPRALLRRSAAPPPLGWLLANAKPSTFLLLLVLPLLPLLLSLLLNTFLMIIDSLANSRMYLPFNRFDTERTLSGKIIEIGEAFRIIRLFTWREDWEERRTVYST